MRRVIPFSCVFLILPLVINTEAVRRQRQAGDSALAAIPCPVQCSWSFAQAWTKAISFEIPTASMMPGQDILTKNDTFSVICTLYRGYRLCLQRCAASNDDYAAVLNAAPSYDNLCVDRKADFDTALPCLVNNTKLFQRTCQKENELLLASAVRLATPQTVNDTTTNDFCRTANNQAFCIFPVLRQTCGDTPYDLLRSVMNASLATVRVSVDEKAITAFYPSCAKYFRTIADGIPVALFNESMPSNDVMQSDNSTVASVTSSHTTTTTAAPTTTQPSEDADLPLSTPSNGGTTNRLGKAFMVIAMIFCFLP